MLRLSIELIPYGDAKNKRHLGTVEIANQGRGDSARADYQVRMIKTGIPTQKWQLGAIQNFSRTDCSIYDLILDALQAKIGPEQKRVIDQLREADIKQRVSKRVKHAHDHKSTRPDWEIYDMMLDALLAGDGPDRQHIIDQLLRIENDNGA